MTRNPHRRHRTEQQPQQYNVMQCNLQDATCNMQYAIRTQSLNTGEAAWTTIAIVCFYRGVVVSFVVGLSVTLQQVEALTGPVRRRRAKVKWSRTRVAPTRRLTPVGGGGGGGGGDGPRSLGPRQRGRLQPPPPTCKYRHPLPPVNNTSFLY